MFIETAYAATEIAAEAAAHAEPSVLGALGVDWKIFIAQLLNFTIVLFVLWKWVYTPLLKALDARKSKIDAGLNDADAAAHAKASAKTEYDAAISAARKETQRLLEEATALADKTKTEMVAIAQVEVAKLVEEGKTRLAEEKEKMVAAARKDIAEVAFMAAEKAMAEVMTDKDRKAMLDAAVKRIVA